MLGIIIVLDQSNTYKFIKTQSIFKKRRGKIAKVNLSFKK